MSGYGVYNGFNIETNEVVGESETVISCSDIAPVKTDNVFFFNYLFVGNKNELPDADGNISMTVDGTTKEINVSDIILTANTKVNGSLDWANAPSDGSVSITVDIAGDWEEAADPNAPQVGDYYYSDGTWSASLDGTKTVVGVVFATADGDASSDAVANYPEVTFADNTIHGWVIAAQDMSGSPRFVETGHGSQSAIEGIEGVGTGESDILGYKNTLAWPNNALTNLAEGTEQDQRQRRHIHCLGKGQRQGCFSHSRDILHQHMSAGKNGCHELFHALCFSDKCFFYFFNYFLRLVLLHDRLLLLPFFRFSRTSP